MKYPNNNVSMNSRFTNVLKLLKKKGITQKNNKWARFWFCSRWNLFSNLKSGKQTTIPKELIDALHVHYNINPEYLLLESDYPFDTAEIKLESFLNFVDDRNVLIGENDQKYLHLFLIEIFMIEFNRATEITDEGFSTLELEKANLKELYLSKSCPEEFVLIPRNNFIEIVSDSIESHKHINSILNLLEYDTYLDAESSGTES